jgi:acyl-homoserine lactone acylase PvdQ
MTEKLNYEYSVRDYPSNVEVFVKITDKDGDFVSSGRVASIQCTGDSPQWQKQEDWGDNETAMTRGSELGSFLKSLKNEELQEWFTENSLGDITEHL